MIELPEEIISHHIMPYAYSPQPLELIRDIKTYHFILKKTVDLYYDAYSYHTKGIIHLILQFDALDFYKSFVIKEHTDESLLNPFMSRLSEEDPNNNYNAGYRFFCVILAKISPLNRLKMYMKMLNTLKNRAVVDMDDATYW
jgi:hypothetical protein|tara:strand:- start:501 stop:926 length:426 start_codon:yes stop_codon:yes gene_type:complete